MIDDNKNPDARLLHRTEAIFHAVLGAAESEREAVLEESCAGDTLLMAELRSLLAACEAEELLGAARAGASGVAAVGGRWVGPYRIERLLGRGGMGAVYLAQRADGHFEQQVAIKVIDLPLATELFRERFRMERQILAGLNHPFIARLFDGGVSEEGELYLAMEYVDGVSIAKFCEWNGLSLRARLELFAKVCGAVQFAHQNLVVHRDLKPDNILVVTDGSPRLLDFGTAKLLVPDADAASGFTRNGLQSFTPQYASPEQVLGEPITTAADTYSLGVLLYLLIAGRPPYELKEFTTAEMLRVICNEVPPKPSAAAAGLDADLDAIVMKALRKEPQERYLTVDQLAGDVQAYLGGRPVGARRGTLRYRAGKFVRRNRLVIAGAAVLLISVLAGIAGVLWQSRSANLQRRRAEARSQDLRQLSVSLLSEIDEAVKQLPGSTPVQRLLVGRVLEHLDRMSKDEDGDRQTQLDLVDAYTHLGNLQGNPYDQNIGDPQGALVSLGKALTIAQGMEAKWPKDSQVLGVLALVEQSRGEVLFGLGRTTESIVSARLAAATFEARAAQPGATALEFAEASSAVGGLGDQLGQAGVSSLSDTDAAVAAYRRALALSERSLALDPNFLRSRRAVAIGHYKIANTRIDTDPAEAIAEYREALAAWNAVPASEKETATVRRGMGATYNKLATAYSEVLDEKSAIATYEKVREIDGLYAAADPDDTRAQVDLAAAISNEAFTYVDMLDMSLYPHPEQEKANRRRAIELLKQVVAIREKLVKVDKDNQNWAAQLAYEKAELGTLEVKDGDPGGAALSAVGIAALREATARPDVSAHVLDLATAARMNVLPKSLQDTALNVRDAERMVALSGRKKASFLVTLAEAYKADGQGAKAVAVAKEGLTLLPAVAPGAAVPRNQKMLAELAKP